jgi:myo-inositol-hexaphosphate 3-phosphohydrolase
MRSVCDRRSGPRTSRLRAAAAAAAFAAGLLRAEPAPAQTALVAAAVETDPTPSSGDSADDAAVWIHPTNPGQSVVIGTDKDGGIGVYDLAGSELQYRADGELNNVDLRYGFLLDGALVDLVVASNDTTDTIAVYVMDPATRTLASVALGGGIPTPIRPYGLCLYRSAVTGKLYAFVDSRGGVVEQWELFDAGGGLVDGTLVREFDVGSQTEGCVADDLAARFYVGEEAVALWRYGAEPGDGEARVQVDTTDVGGHLVADVEGLALYTAQGGVGYLVASSQGADAYVLYERAGSNAYVGTFQIVDGPAIDGTTGTDGIEVSNAALGAAFPFGVFVAQDGDNGEENQNYKLVPWESIAGSFEPPLVIDPTFSPRPSACQNGFDDDGDAKIDFPEDPQCTSPDDDSEVVPEPAEWVLWLAALVVVAALTRGARRATHAAGRPGSPGRLSARP